MWNLWQICSKVKKFERWRVQNFVSFLHRYSYWFMLYADGDLKLFKGTLMNIWKSASIFVFIWKQFVENFTLKHLLLFEICAREICERFVYKHSETIESFLVLKFIKSYLDHKFSSNQNQLKDTSDVYYFELP